jgi:AraC-like DNA-binding protein
MRGPSPNSGGRPAATTASHRQVIRCRGSMMPESMRDFRITSDVGTGRTLSALMAQQGELRGALPGFGDGSVWTITAPLHDYAQCAGGLAPWQLRRAQQMLLANIESNLPLRHVSEACRLSVSHFARGFKISTGLSPLKWLIALRIDLSRRTLMASDISLVDVAGMYGFCDQSHFSRVFRRVVGRSPGAWRREYRDDSRFPEPRSTVAWIDFTPARNAA